VIVTGVAGQGSGVGVGVGEGEGVGVVPGVGVVTGVGGGVGVGGQVVGKTPHGTEPGVEPFGTGTGTGMGTGPVTPADPGLWQATKRAPPPMRSAVRATPKDLFIPCLRKRPAGFKLDMNSWLGRIAEATLLVNDDSADCHRHA
jgi:hypothetical protein